VTAYGYADNQPMTLLILADWALPPLTEDLGFEVVGRYGAADAPSRIAVIDPGFAVVQIADPSDVTRIRQKNPRPRLVVAAPSRESSFATRTIMNGAHGYVPLDGPAEFFVAALKAAKENRIYIAPFDDAGSGASARGRAQDKTSPPAAAAPPVELAPPVAPARAISILLADDHAIVREGLAALCSSNPRFRVVAQCADGEQALETILRDQPDFAILDLHMPKLTGLEVIRRLRSQGATTKLVVLSIGREDQVVMEALRAGADAYLLKDGPSNHLLDAINFVSEGGVYVSPLLGGAKLFTRGDIPRAEDPLASLSPREMEVFSYLVNGLRAKDIAELLDISPKTVDTYRASLMRKLGVHDLVGLVKFAIERNLTSTTTDSQRLKREEPDNEPPKGRRGPSAG
jgi:DNA-binding NarL/FixJ family response regulator